MGCVPELIQFECCEATFINLNLRIGA